MKMTKNPKAPKRSIDSRPRLNKHDVLLNLITTESAMKNVESANTLVFNVAPRASKINIKEAFQMLYNVKPIKVNTLNTMKGTKKAFCRLPHEIEAFDLASKLATV